MPVQARQPGVPGWDAAGCLTTAEVQVLEKWYGGARPVKDEQIYPGLPLGSEPYWSRWHALDDRAKLAG